MNADQLFEYLRAELEKRAAHDAAVLEQMKAQTDALQRIAASLKPISEHFE